MVHGNWSAVHMVRVGAWHGGSLIETSGRRRDVIRKARYVRIGYWECLFRLARRGGVGDGVGSNNVHVSKLKSSIFLL